ncbi:MAG TPA: OmpH family outer membrane protein [Draconibacterium sp.]|jgi:outer membrane protein|nr:OmpH family outer membrane protein [Draconibacterium sp.]
MRNLIRIITVFLFVGITATVSAQTPKFGHIDLQALIQLMPERATAETEFLKFQGDLEDIFGEMQKDLQTKMTEFEALGTEASEIKRNAKIAEIQDMQQRIQNYQQTAQAQLNQKQTELLKPVFDKAEKTIEEVAKEKSLLYVFDIGSKVVLYKSNESLDVLPLVKTKLGI